MRSTPLRDIDFLLTQRKRKIRDKGHFTLLGFQRRPFAVCANSFPGLHRVDVLHQGSGWQTSPAGHTLLLRKETVRYELAHSFIQSIVHRWVRTGNPSIDNPKRAQMLNLLFQRKYTDTMEAVRLYPPTCANKATGNYETKQTEWQIIAGNRTVPASARRLISSPQVYLLSSSVLPSQVRGYSDAQPEAPCHWVKAVPSGSQNREAQRGARRTATAPSILALLQLALRRSLTQWAELHHRQSRRLPRKAAHRLRSTRPRSSGSLRTRGRSQA